ncbi:MAG: hypothetical protein AB8H86_16635 [Polyangiales bacterium]
MTKKRPEPEAGKITRRKKGEGDRKRLSPDLERFARGDDKRFRPSRPPRGPRINDPRPVFLIAGVANRDARIVLSDYSERLHASAAAAAAEPKAAAYFDRTMAEVLWLKLWRGDSLTSFASYVENVLEMNVDEAREAARRHAEGEGRDLTPLSDEIIAIWLRAAAGAIEAEGILRIREIDGELFFQVNVDEAPEVLYFAGRRMSPLVQDRAPTEEPPRSARRVEEAPVKKRRNKDK